MAKGATGNTQPGKTRPTILVNSALWVEFRKWAKGQGKTLPRAVEDALRGAMIKQQVEICIAGDGKEEAMRFELTENHIKLLNRMCVYFEDEAYSGAPAVDIKRPYGNSSVAYDIFEIINGKEWDDDEMPVGVREKLIDLHRETATALQVVLDTMSFKPGVYEKERYGIRWRIIEERSGKQPAAQDAKRCA